MRYITELTTTEFSQLAEKYLSDFESDMGKVAHCYLVELADQSKLKKIQVDFGVIPWFAWNIDEAKGKGRRKKKGNKKDTESGVKLSNALSGIESVHHRTCDYVLLVLQDKSLHVIYLDLKSEKPKTDHAISQFKSTAAFMRYVAAIFQTYEQVLVPNEFVEHFVLLQRKSDKPDKPSYLFRSGTGIVHGSDGRSADSPKFVYLKEGKDKLTVGQMLR